MLKRTTGEHQGTIILNVYSDDGLASIDNEELWRQFMNDFKEKFEVVEKDPDYFLGAGIIQHEDGSVEIDPSKYLRESVAKYDMHHAVTSPLPMPAGSKLYMDHGAHLGDDGINLFQQMTGTIMYASLLRPELCYYASQLGKVMSAPSEPHMVLARKVLQYISGTLDEKHTFHPCGHKGFRPEDLSLQAFSDSDWACSVDTRRSHGCYIIMLAGAAVSHRSRTHKSIMHASCATSSPPRTTSSRILGLHQHLRLPHRTSGPSLTPTGPTTPRTASLSPGTQSSCTAISWPGAAGGRTPSRCHPLRPSTTP